MWKETDITATDKILFLFIGLSLESVKVYNTCIHRFNNSGGANVFAVLFQTASSVARLHIPLPIQSGNPKHAGASILLPGTPFTIMV